MSCLLWLKTWAGQANDRPALVTVGPSGEIITSTWRTVLHDVCGVVQAIDRAGFAPGECLAHDFGNSREGVLIALASLIAGTIEVPLDPALSQSEFTVATFARRWGSDVGLSSGTHALASVATNAALAHREQLLSPDHPAIILFTSGSTGQPRGVTLSRKNLFTNAQAKLIAAPQTSSDIRLTVLPLWHAYARTCDLMTWLIAGCTLAVGQGWDGWQQLAPAVTPTLINTVPSFASRLLSQAIDTEAASKLRMLGCGGAAMTCEQFSGFQEQGITVIQGYGLTEASPVICSATPQNIRPGFVGQPVNGCEVQIDEQGQLKVRGDGVMLGYWNDDAATHATINHGWLSTGDCVEIDANDGQFRILGRSDDRITLSNGRKFFPGPIEQRIAMLPGILHALLIPNDRHVDLFIDMDKKYPERQHSFVDIEQVLKAFPAWQHPRYIHTTPKPFAQIRHAVTAKGTLRRNVAISSCKKLKTENFFPYS